MPSHSMRVRANQKLGIACPMTAMVSAVRSIRLFGRIAASTPSGIDIASANTRAQSPSSMVVGSRSKITWATGCFR